jgi:N-acetylglutamate synthase-like GNAT family acetyltransferase
LLRKMTALPQVRRGQPADIPDVLALLQSTDLPTSDLSAIAGLRTWVIESDDCLCGVIALEPFGTEGLLRSLAVAPDYRNRGMGHALVAQLETDARAQGVRKLVLLTQTAETFFRSLGYQNIDRRHVSDEMKQCAEFWSLCPASASCMAKALVNLADAERADA